MSKRFCSSTGQLALNCACANHRAAAFNAAMNDPQARTAAASYLSYKTQHEPIRKLAKTAIDYASANDGEQAAAAHDAVAAAHDAAAEQEQGDGSLARKHMVAAEAHRGAAAAHFAYGTAAAAAEDVADLGADEDVEDAQGNLKKPARNSEYRSLLANELAAEKALEADLADVWDEPTLNYAEISVFGRPSAERRGRAGRRARSEKVAVDEYVANALRDLHGPYWEDDEPARGFVANVPPTASKDDEDDVWDEPTLNYQDICAPGLRKDRQQPTAHRAKAAAPTGNADDDDSAWEEPELDYQEICAPGLRRKA